VAVEEEEEKWKFMLATQLLQQSGVFDRALVLI